MLLKHALHKSTSFKHESLTKLRDRFTSSPDVLAKHLDDVIEKCAILFLDSDAAVRSEARKLLRQAFTVHRSSAGGADDMISQTGIAQLCCAMTHIEEAIKLDSLLILDLFLEHAPRLVARSSGRLLPIFAGLISRPRIMRAAQSSSSQGGRDRQSSAASGSQQSLLVNPTSQMSSQKWRVRVLDRLGKFFSALEESCRHPKASKVGETHVPAWSRMGGDRVISTGIIYGKERIMQETVCSFILRYSSAILIIQFNIVTDCFRMLTCNDINHTEKL